MEEGEIIEEFTAKDGRSFLIRVPTLEDTREYLNFINELVRENTWIEENKEQTYESEEAYMKDKIGKIVSGTEISLAAFYNGKLVADADIIRGHGRAFSTGSFAIAVLNGYRDAGLGTELMKLILDKAKEAGYRIITLGVYGDNARAMHLYEKFGFVKAGIIPKYAYFEGKGFVDAITLYKILQE